MEQACGTSTHGNTSCHECADSDSTIKAMKRKQRGYMITYWHQEYHIHELPSGTIYMCICDDSTKDGKYHGHAFIYYKNPVTMGRVKKQFGNDCHVEKPYKNSECIAYVMDTTKRKYNIEEYGKRPMDNGVKRTIQELKDIDDPSELDWRMYNTWKRVHDDYSNDIDINEWHKDIDVYYIYGQSGVGKSNKAKEIINDYECILPGPCNVIKHDGEFYHGVGVNAQKAIYDDFRDSHMKASEFINMIDYNKHTMNVKGGTKINKYKLIVITSVQSPYDIYKNLDDEPRLQWLRRVHIIDMTERDEWGLPINKKDNIVSYI